MDRAAMLEVAFSASAMAVALLDVSNRPIMVNPTFEQQLGPLFKLQHMALNDATADDKANADIAQALKRARENGTTERVRDSNMLTVAGPAGFPLPRHFDWSLRLGKDGIVVASASAVSEADEQQRERDAELLDFFQNAPIAMHWLSGTGEIMWANNTELRVLGYTAEEYIGQPVMKFCPDEEELVLEIFKQLGSGNTIKDVPVRFRAKDGRIVPLLIDSNVNYTKAGDFNHTRCFIRDDTGRRIREARKDARLSEAVRTHKLFDAFVSRTLHLIRTPCHILAQDLEDAQESLARGDALTPQGEIEPSCAKSMDNARRMVDRINQMTVDFFEARKVEEGAEFLMSMAEHDLVMICKDAVVEAQDLCKPGVHVSLEFEEGGHLLRTDEAALRRVLHHLLRNAAHATSAGSIKVHVSHLAQAVQVRVSDTGCGLDPNDKYTFARYRQPPPSELEASGMSEDVVQRSRVKLEADLSLSSGNEGIGIGLSLCYALVAALGGELRYESRPRDTSFWFSLPRAESEAGPSQPAFTIEAFQVLASKGEAEADIVTRHRNKHSRLSMEAPSIAATSTVPTLPTSESDSGSWNEAAHPSKVARAGIFESGRAPHVLAVDDSPLCRKALSTMLTKLGCTFDLAEDGVEAVEKLRAGMEDTRMSYDIVLMDIRMPNMDGHQATRIARDELHCTQVPIVAVSAEAVVDTTGFTAIQPKPITAKVLKHVLRVHCSSLIAND
eukprot:CAMPEP_0185541974 /NCGR_PEP_ID=MMETSP1381-20130426/2315_1 /TAXON_ID=298111 /ORGANISM="Pavlova sp., Strain CCMP459" /LENGTH=727 /DNA_ID=CAMNT_0028153931 /DNA_START=12 /DNA_END=2195 /DNA_ORIENTATION=-